MNTNKFGRLKAIDVSLNAGLSEDRVKRLANSDEFNAFLDRSFAKAQPGCRCCAHVIIDCIELCLVFDLHTHHLVVCTPAEEKSWRCAEKPN